MCCKTQDKTAPSRVKTSYVQAAVIQRSFQQPIQRESRSRLLAKPMRTAWSSSEPITTVLAVPPGTSRGSGAEQLQECGRSGHARIALVERPEGMVSSPLSGLCPSCPSSASAQCPPSPWQTSPPPWPPSLPASATRAPCSVQTGPVNDREGHSRRAEKANT